MPDFREFPIRDFGSSVNVCAVICRLKSCQVPHPILTALVGSGFPTDKFFFSGFLPPKSGGRERELKAAAARAETSIFFESPHRIIKTLTAAQEIMPERILCVARELTKKFEEYRRGRPEELLAHYSAKPPKGEIVLLISGGG